MGCNGQRRMRGCCWKVGDEGGEKFKNFELCSTYSELSLHIPCCRFLDMLLYRYLSSTSYHSCSRMIIESSLSLSS